MVGREELCFVKGSYQANLRLVIYITNSLNIRRRCFH